MPLFRSRRARTGLISLAVVTVSAAALGRVPTLQASQTTTTVSPAQAAPYLGDWTAPVSSQMGPMTFAVSVKVDDGRVTATVGGGMFPPASASEISLSRKNLFLKYASFNFHWLYPTQYVLGDLQADDSPSSPAAP